MLKGRKHFKLSENMKTEYMLFIFVFIYLSFILTSGYYSDDTHISVMRGILKYRDISVLSFMKENILLNIESGRFFPITVIVSWIFPGLFSLKIYKTLIIIMCMIDLYLIGRVVKKITGSRKMALNTMLVTSISFTLLAGYSHSAFLSFGMNIQFLLMFCLLSFIKCMDYCEDRERKDLILSLFFWVLGLLTYEIAYIFVFIIFWIIYCQVKKDNNKKLINFIRLAVPYCIVGIIMFGIYVFIRMNASEVYAGASVKLNLSGNIKTLFIQLTSSLPLFNYVMQGTGYGMTLSVKYIVEHITFKDVFLSVQFVYLAYRINPDIYDVKEDKVKNRFPLFIFGIMLLVLPASLIAVSSKYQTLPLGTGYIPVFIQYFGLAIIFITIIMIIQSKIHNKYHWRALRSIFLCLGVIVILLNQQNSRFIIDQNNYHNGWTEYWKRTVYEDAIKSGILDDVDDEQEYILTPPSFFDYRQRGALIAQLTDRTMNVFAYGDEGVAELDINDIYVMNYDAAKNMGYVVLGKAVNDVVENNQYFVESFKIYIKNSGNDYNSVLLGDGAEFKVVKLDTAKVIKKTTEGCLYSFTNQPVSNISSIIPIKIN